MGGGGGGGAAVKGCPAFACEKVGKKQELQILKNRIKVGKQKEK